MVPPHPRPWRRAVHRPARPLRHHPSSPTRFRRPSRPPRSCTPSGWCGSRPVRRRRDARNPDLRLVGGGPVGPPPWKFSRSDIEVLGPNAAISDAGVSRPCVGVDTPRSAPQYLFPSTLRRELLQRNHHEAGAIIDSLRRRMKEQGFCRFPDPDPDRIRAPKLRAISCAIAHHPGKFYRGCRSAPQQFKQLTMIRDSTAIFHSRVFRDEEPWRTFAPASSTSSPSR